MKTKIFTLLLAVAASMGTMFASTKIGDLYYNLDATNQTAEVTYQLQLDKNNYKGLTSANIPASVEYNSVAYSVTSIGRAAFYGCSGLTSVTIPNSVTSIGEYAFYGCSGLTGELVIPNSVTSIGGGAFYGCSGLTSVTIPNSVTSIGNNAFAYCSGLTSISIPESVTSIGIAAFAGCTGLTSIDVATDNPNYCSAEGVLFNKDKSTIVAFLGTKQGKYTIPNSVTSIGGSAFYGCTGLTSIEIPNSVTSIGNYAFEDCSGLTSISIPESVTSIGIAAFYGCTGLTSIEIPNSVTSIGGSAFYGCTGLTSIEIPNSVTSIDNYAFYECSGLTSVTIPNSVTSIGYEAFSGCTGLTSVTIPDSVTSIGSYAFLNCSGLTSVTIPNGVIGWRAFSGCTGLTSVTIGNGVTSIEFGAFEGCINITSVIWNAKNCTDFTSDITPFYGHIYVNGGHELLAFNIRAYILSFVFGEKVEHIPANLCKELINLTSVTFETETPPTLGGDAFDNTNNCPIYVPCGSLDTYKTAEGWSDYASRIKYAPLPYKISTQAENGSVATTDVATISICEPFVTCTATPDYGYHFTQWSDGLKDNPRIAQITQDTTFTAEFAPDRVGTCGKDLALVWSYDPTNKVLTIGNAGSFTENMQFGAEAPNEMEELVIGNSVTAIGANAFAGIETLKKVSIGESVKTIGEQAFYNCVNLETIFNYRPTPTNAYSTAFDGVDKFECTLYVLPSSIDMYKAAAVWRDFYYTYAIGAKEATVTTNDVQVEPQDNAATVTWPTSNNAATYTIQITKDGVVFCTLIFNANGQLTGIAFAPSRDGQAHAPAATKTANGLQFTVTGLDSGTQYGYSVTAKDANDQPVATYSGEFTTTSEGTATGVEGIQPSEVSYQKILHNGQIFILRGEKVYTLQGQEVR